MMLIDVAYGAVVGGALVVMAALLAGLAVFLLFRRFRSAIDCVLTDVYECNFNRLFFALAVSGACLYGGAKNGAGQGAPNGSGLQGLLQSPSASQVRAGGGNEGDSPDESTLSFTSFSMSSNIAAFGLSWKTNFSPARAWLELYEKLHSLTNPWLPRLVRELPENATNDAFEVLFTNGVPAAAFYSARVDTLHVEFPGLGMTEGPDGRRVYTSFGSRNFTVAVSRPQRPDAYPPFDPAFAVNPFVYVDGLTYDPDTSTLRTGNYGVYELPDGSVLAAFANPKVSFGSPHDYAGTTLSYDSGAYAKVSPYPLSTPALQKGWSRGTTPGTGCSCVPSVDFGGGLVVRGSSGTALRANGSGLPPGMRTDYEYEDGGVWVTLYNHTNVVWRKWCEHRRYADNGGTSDELGGPQDEDECGCGDEDALEGSSAGSVRFRIPLGSANEGEVSGFLYFNRNEPFDVTPSAFELLCRGDANVTDGYGPDGTRTVICRARHGRKLVVRGREGENGVDIEVRDTASDDLLHMWTVTRDGSTVRIVQVSVLDNTMQDKSYEYDEGEWTETDNISGLSDRRIAQDRLNGDGTLREERIVTCAGKVAIHVITESRRFGTGTNAVLRETERRELGADDTWKVSRASYWDDAAHPRRHGSLRLEQGDDRAWSYRAYDDGGRIVFRLDQRDGSEVPADALGYSITNLPPVSAAFATTYDYGPLVGDACRSNDWMKVRTESKYVVEKGAAILIGRTWNTYGRGMSDGYPTIVLTKERAASQSAQRGDAGNAVSVEACFDDESESVPYVLRGEPASETDENGVTTRYERTNERGVLRTVERRFFNGNEAKTRRVTERDWNYGNLLYEAEAISADGTEFGWARHAYDEKNRLRFTQYDDGSWETNAYSCCRLLWTIDRTGARRTRQAATGTDDLLYAELEDYVADMPKDIYYDTAWRSHVVFAHCFPAVQHFNDGLMRETNSVIRSARRSTPGNDATFPDRGYVHSARTEYPQGVSDLSVRTDERGLRTVRRVESRQDAAIEVSEEYPPGSTVPDAVTTNVEYRGGDSVCLRSSSERRVRTARFATYAADGKRLEVETEERSDGECVTNRLAVLDFLGRCISEMTPLTITSFAYDGPSSRVLTTSEARGGLVTDNVFDEMGEPVGSVSCGVERTILTDYIRLADAWWRVETRTESSGSATISSDRILTRLTGLSDALRAERMEFHNGTLRSHTTSAFDPSGNTVTETTDDAVEGQLYVKSQFGLPVETGSRAGRIQNFYGPTGRIFSRQRIAASGSGWRYLDANCVNGLGDELSRLIATRYDITVTPFSEYAYDCRGNLSAATNELGDVVLTASDPDGNVIAEDGDTYPTHRDYDSRGNRTSLDTTRDRTIWDATGWRYDPQTGLAVAKTYADDSSVGYTHTPDGLPLRTTNPDGSWTENVYDAGRRLVGIASSDPSCAADFANDVFGRAVAAASTVAAYAYALSPDGIATNESVSVGGREAALVRGLDPHGRLVSLSADGRPATAVVYADSGLIAGLSNAECRVDYLYDALGGDMGRTLVLSNGVSFVRSLTRHDYLRDEVLSVVDVCGTDTRRYDYTYDALRRPITRNADTFAYNRRGEVANEVVAGVVRTHAYDFIGNEQPANCLNQYLGLAHSPNGELVSDGTFAYAYDALSRLTAAYSNGTLVVSNRYDHLGRRIVKIAADGTHTFLYDGWRPLVESIVRSDNSTDRIDYVWGKDLSGTLDGAAGIGGLLYVKINGVIFVPFYDAYGNVMGYRNAEGNVVASYTYDAFGRTVAQNGTMVDVFAMRYSTKYYDKETGLYYYGKRYYSPVWRRWLTRDPIGEEGGVNLYAFCLGDPVSCFDPLGLKLVIVKHWKGIDPPAHWGDGNKGQTYYTEPDVTYKEVAKSRGKIGFAVTLTPPITIVNVYFRASSNLGATDFDENQHLALYQKIDDAFETFKAEAEAIVDCPEHAKLRLRAAIGRLNRKRVAYWAEDNALDAPGGPHGH